MQKSVGSADFSLETVFAKDLRNDRSIADDDSDNLSETSSKDSGCGHSTSKFDLDSSSSLHWGASLLYYTGLPSPRVKEHHFTDGSLKRSAVSMLDVSPNRQDPDGRSLVKKHGVSNSPLRDSAIPSSPTDSTSLHRKQRPNFTSSSAPRGIISRLKTASNSFRFFQTSGPPFPKMEGTKSLQSGQHSSSSKSSLKSVGKVLKHSFRARHLLPSTTSSKVDSTETQVFPPSSQHHPPDCNEDNDDITVTCFTAPIMKKSGQSLGKTWRKFSSTLSLHPGGGDGRLHKYNKSVSTSIISASPTGLIPPNLGSSLENLSHKSVQGGNSDGGIGVSKKETCFPFITSSLGESGGLINGGGLMEEVKRGRRIGKVIRVRKGGHRLQTNSRGVLDFHSEELKSQEVFGLDKEPRVSSISPKAWRKLERESSPAITSLVGKTDKNQEIQQRAHEAVVGVGEKCIDDFHNPSKLSHYDEDVEKNDDSVESPRADDNDANPVKGSGESGDDDNDDRGESGKSDSEVITLTPALGLLLDTSPEKMGRKQKGTKGSSGKDTKRKLDSQTLEMGEVSCVTVVAPHSPGESKESQVLLGKSSELLSSSSSPSLPALDDNGVAPAVRRRKSSEDYKDWRKNGVRNQNGDVVVVERETPSPEDLENGEYGNGSSCSVLNGNGNGMVMMTMSPRTKQFTHHDNHNHRNTNENELSRNGGSLEGKSASEYYAEKFKELTGGRKEVESDEDVKVEKEVANEKDLHEVGNETDPETACTQSFRQLEPFNYDLEPVKKGKKERLYKVLVVGELGAGKTSIIKRYVHQFFSQHYRATIGVDFALKVLRWDPEVWKCKLKGQENSLEFTVVRLQLWDIAGQERFGSMTRVYYKEAVGAFVVFDVTRSATLEAVPKWKADLDAKVALPDGRPIPTVLLANKSDQPKEGIAANREKMNEFCQQQGFSAWFETSAKDNINIDESANFLVSKILEMDKWSQEPLASDPDKLDLTANGKHNAASSSNCAC